MNGKEEKSWLIKNRPLREGLKKCGIFHTLYIIERGEGSAQK